MRSRGVSIRCCWPPKDWVRHWSQPAVTRPRRSRCLHAGYAAAGPRSRARSTSPASPAIDNAAKHAGPAEVYVRAWDTPQALHFTVRDTGCGFDPNGTPSGAGLNNMHDRIAAVGGTLAVDSRPSHGTRLHGTVPDPWPGATAGRRPRGYPALRPPTSAASRHNPGPPAQGDERRRRRSNIAVICRPLPGNTTPKKRSSRLSTRPRPRQVHNGARPARPGAAEIEAHRLHVTTSFPVPSVARPTASAWATERFRGRYRPEATSTGALSASPEIPIAAPCA